MALWKREWLVEERADGTRDVPGFVYLSELPANVRIQLIAILDAVRHMGPDSWRDRRTHKGLKGDADRVHQAGDKQGETLYRLFLRWQRPEKRVVVLGGATKPNGTALSDSEYELAQARADRADEGPDSFATADDLAGVLLNADPDG